MPGAKTSVYLDQRVLEAIREEASRQDRSISFIISQSWLIAQETLRGYPGMRDYMAVQDADESDSSGDDTQDVTDSDDFVEEI